MSEVWRGAGACVVGRGGRSAVVDAGLQNVRKMGRPGTWRARVRARGRNAAAARARSSLVRRGRDTVVGIEEDREVCCTPSRRRALYYGTGIEVVAGPSGGVCEVGRRRL